MQWLYGNLFVLSVILVTAGLMFLFGSLMWALGLPPDEYPVLCLLAGVGSLIGGGRYFGWALDCINKRALDKVLGGRL